VTKDEGDHRYRSTMITAVSTLPPAVHIEAPSAACLVVIHGKDIGRRIAMDGNVLECGRSMQIDIPIDDEAASRKHARFAWTGSSYIVSDLGSTNGTFVNDVHVRERTLHDGDRIQVGRTIFKFICGSNIELLYHEEIYRLMACDGLTQVHNKRSFEVTLEREVSRSNRYKRPLSLVLFDIDHFKSINDTHGHLAGDVVLRQMAAMVSANVRREDTLARVGGEEFGLLLPEVSMEAARAVAEKLRVIIERTPCTFEETRIDITSSFGVAELSFEGNMGPTELYQAADAQLYAAKKAGRNRVM